MRSYHLSRRRFFKLAGGALAAALSGRGRAQDEVVRVGCVLPTQTGQLASDSQRLASEAALKGAIMAGEDFGLTAGGDALQVLISSAPDAAAAVRAAARLRAVEQVAALIGGFGTAQAQALSAFAEEQQLLFLNIGAPDDGLRLEGCRRFTFHIEASAAMYLDALTDWWTRTGSRRWFFVFSATREGRALYRRAQHALAKRRPVAQEVGRAAVSARPDYREVIEGIGVAGADVVVLLTDWRPQLDFLGHYEAAGLACAVTGLPYPVTQTRDFLRSVWEAAPQQVSDDRVALWEATLIDGGAKGLNRRFLERWGAPMDPSAWAAYQGVRIFSDAITVTGAPDGPSLVDFLESPEAVFDLQKGSAVSFRSWDHQLRQPLYVVRGKVAPEDGELVELVGELPRATSGAHPVARLDQLGDRQRGVPC